MGSVGSGKTEAIQTLSDVPVALTEVAATDDVRTTKQFTTVSMDAGVLELGSGDRVRLVGAPGQARFDFMWDILLEQVQAVVVLIDFSRSSCLDDLKYFLEELRGRVLRKRLVLAVGITHSDGVNSRLLAPCKSLVERSKLPFLASKVPVFHVDARSLEDMRAMIVGVVAILEMERKFVDRR